MKNLLAALTLFTRLSFWRLAKLEAKHFERATDYWPFAGWVTGGAMALTLWVAAGFLPVAVAAWLALGVRMLVSGALHEDGLADFCDAFGGRNDRLRTLAILKDSHIGTYGVLGLIVYLCALHTMLCALPLAVAPAVALAADVWAKAAASWLVRLLPYARTAQEAKTRVVYAPRRDVAGLLWHALRCAVAVAPPAALLWQVQAPLSVPVIMAPVGVLAVLAVVMKRRIGGYTGDCCGTVYLLAEASIYLCLLPYFA